MSYFSSAFNFPFCLFPKYSPLPELQSVIPQNIRDSIQRLISLQASEEEERRQALADSNLLLSDDESDMDDSGEIPLQVRVSGGDTEDTAPVDSDVEAVKVSRRNQQNQTNGMPDKERYEILRTLYLDDPGLFDRDGVTRRSDGRKKMREMLGWDDGQIEGWRVMLERDVSFKCFLAGAKECHADLNTFVDSPKRTLSLKRIVIGWHVKVHYLPAVTTVTIVTITAHDNHPPMARS